jgi:hypothetical protein
MEPFISPIRSFNPARGAIVPQVGVNSRFLQTGAVTSYLGLMLGEAYVLITDIGIPYCGLQ